jgi:sigma-B regulation protein RsbU (phosphoserine phosphatase)
MKKSYKILVADDSPSVLASVREMLNNDKDENHILMEAKNGAEIISLISNELPDIILTDIEMPIMNGIDAINFIRRNKQAKEIPIIVMSSTMAIQEAFEAGADDFIMKPFNQYELLLRIHLNIRLSDKSKMINNQNQLLKAQKQEVTLQRDTIAKQQKELIDDIRYASFIQNAIMPDEKTMGELLRSHFIFNKPKNQVSGDFYWIAKKKDKVLIVLGDCTGHGLSGALMTMAGMAILNETINNCEEIEPNLILNMLRTQVIKLLHQKGSIGEASNGMDLALCILDYNTGIMEYAGANNPVYIVRTDNTLEVIKADRMPIGIHVNFEKSFSKVVCNLYQGDMLYLFSDGYADQFGGPNGQKFRYDQFKELLRGISKNSVEEQKSIVESTFTNWIGDFEQIDDVMILGIKFQ